MREHFTTREDGRAGDMDELEIWTKDLHDRPQQCGNWIVALVWWGLILGVIGFWLGMWWLIAR